MLSQDIYLKYYNQQYNIGLADLKSVWLLEEEPLQLHPAVYRGLLAYRLPKTGKRISYKQLKKGLIKKEIVLKLPVNLVPF